MTLAGIIQSEGPLMSDILARTNKKNDSCVVLEKNENSFLVPFAKESTQEFFELVFAPTGPFWNTYATMGLGEAPSTETYCVFLAHQMYFCKNTELTFVYTNSIKKSLLWKNNQLQTKTVWNTDNALRVLAAPFEIFSQAQQVMISAFIANEALIQFKEEIEKSETYYAQALQKKSWTVSATHEALTSAVESMQYAFLFTLAHTLKLKASSAAKELVNYTRQTATALYSTKEKSSAYGFWGDDPYDISKPRMGDGAQLSQKDTLLPSETWLLLREQAKYVCARYLAIERMGYLAFGKKYGLGEHIFHLQTTELTQSSKGLATIAKERKETFDKDSQTFLPSRLIHTTEWFFDPSTIAQQSPKQKTTNENQQSPLILEGKSVGAKKIVTGDVVWIYGREDLKKSCVGKIIVTTYFSPNLVEAFSGALGIMSSVGGALSHPAIIAREKGLPCIVGVNDLSRITSHSRVTLDGITGKIHVILK